MPFAWDQPMGPHVVQAVAHASGADMQQIGQQASALSVVCRQRVERGFGAAVSEHAHIPPRARCLLLCMRTVLQCKNGRLHRARRAGPATRNMRIRQRGKCTPAHPPSRRVVPRMCSMQAATQIHLDEIADNVKVLHVQQPSLAGSASMPVRSNR
eukprot:1158605-Pelagomonas_calceolata.AAC.6